MANTRIELSLENIPQGVKFILCDSHVLIKSFKSVRDGMKVTPLLKTVWLLLDELIELNKGIMKNFD